MRGNVSAAVRKTRGKRHLLDDQQQANGREHAHDHRRRHIRRESPSPQHAETELDHAAASKPKLAPPAVHRMNRTLGTTESMKYPGGLVAADIPGILKIFQSARTGKEAAAALPAIPTMDRAGPV